MGRWKINQLLCFIFVAVVQIGDIVNSHVFALSWSLSLWEMIPLLLQRQQKLHFIHCFTASALLLMSLKAPFKLSWTWQRLLRAPLCLVAFVFRLQEIFSPKLCLPVFVKIPPFHSPLSIVVSCTVRCLELILKQKYKHNFF